MDRREFSVELARLMLGGAAITITGCGGSSPTESTPVFTDTTGTVSENHGHAALITAAQLGAGGAVELDITGTSSHPHVVSLTAAEVQSIGRGSRVEKESTGNRHTHTVVFNA